MKSKYLTLSLVVLLTQLFGCSNTSVKEPYDGQIFKAVNYKYYLAEEVYLLDNKLEDNILAFPLIVSKPLTIDDISGVYLTTYEPNDVSSIVNSVVSSYSLEECDANETDSIYKYMLNIHFSEEFKGNVLFRYCYCTIGNFTYKFDIYVTTFITKDCDSYFKKYNFTFESRALVKNPYYQKTVLPEDFKNLSYFKYVAAYRVNVPFDYALTNDCQIGKILSVANLSYPLSVYRPLLMQITSLEGLGSPFVLSPKNFSVNLDANVDYYVYLYHNSIDNVLFYNEQYPFALSERSSTYRQMSFPPCYYSSPTMSQPFLSEAVKCELKDLKNIRLW